MDIDPVCEFSDHIAAVKAVGWSPHQHGTLASGGGTADRYTAKLCGYLINFTAKLQTIGINHTAKF